MIIKFKVFNPSLITLLQYMFNPFRCAWFVNKKMYKVSWSKEKHFFKKTLSLNCLPRVALYECYTGAKHWFRKCQSKENKPFFRTLVWFFRHLSDFLNMCRKGVLEVSDNARRLFLEVPAHLGSGYCWQISRWCGHYGVAHQSEFKNFK